MIFEVNSPRLAFVSMTGYGLIAYFCQNHWCSSYGLHTSAVLDRVVNSTVNSGSPDVKEPKE